MAGGVPAHGLGVPTSRPGESGRGRVVENRDYTKCTRGNAQRTAADGDGESGERGVREVGQLERQYACLSSF